jgi:hypothetical protein
VWIRSRDRHRCLAGRHDGPGEAVRGRLDACQVESSPHSRSSRVRHPALAVIAGDQRAPQVPDAGEPSPDPPADPPWPLRRAAQGCGALIARRAEQGAGTLAGRRTEQRVRGTQCPEQPVKVIGGARARMIPAGVWPIPRHRHGLQLAVCRPRLLGSCARRPVPGICGLPRLRGDLLTCRSPPRGDHGYPR